MPKCTRCYWNPSARARHEWCLCFACESTPTQQPSKWLESNRQLCFVRRILGEWKLRGALIYYNSNMNACTIMNAGKFQQRLAPRPSVRCSPSGCHQLGIGSCLPFKGIKKCSSSPRSDSLFKNDRVCRCYRKGWLLVLNTLTSIQGFYMVFGSIPVGRLAGTIKDPFKSTRYCLEG